MKKYIALYKDDVAGDFGFFGVFNNPELAKRDFKFGASQSPHAEDISLYIAGSFDTDTGAIDNMGDDSLGKYPSYIMRGSKE